MKLILSSPDMAEVGLILGRLETAGISCEVRNESLSQAMVGSPFDPELWVLNYGDYQEALDLVEAWRKGN